MKKQFQILLILVLVVSAGCELFNPGKSYYHDNETLRSYPEALDLEITTVQKAKNEIVPPDSVNVDAYVVSINICPEDWRCYLPDGIVISDSLNPQTSISQLHLAVINPQQFEEKKLYRVSLKITGRESDNIRYFSLLGYSSLLRYD